MSLLLKIGTDSMRLERAVFNLLLSTSHTAGSKACEQVRENGSLTIASLRKIAQKAQIPYPLFFAPRAVVETQIKLREHELSTRINRREFMLALRGKTDFTKIEQIVLDLARKQDALNKIYPKTEQNSFLACLERAKLSVSAKSEFLRGKIGFSLKEFRTRSKKRALEYLRECVESKNILVSFSSYNFMPHNLDRDIQVSGWCVKDKKFPYIFINTRDGEEKPLIIESDGRKIFTLTAMLVSVALNKFVFVLPGGGPSRASKDSVVYEIASEFLLPAVEMKLVKPLSLEELKEQAGVFKVTPSLLLARLKFLSLIDRNLATAFKQELTRENNETKKEPKKFRKPSDVGGFEKYNGVRFSTEIVAAIKLGKVSDVDAKRLLFRATKMHDDLLRSYVKKFSR